MGLPGLYFDCLMRIVGSLCLHAANIRAAARVDFNHFAFIDEEWHADSGNRKLAAEQLGIGRTTLYSKMRLYGIKYKE